MTYYQKLIYDFKKMTITRVLLLILFFFTIVLVTPKTSRAIDLQETLTSENSIVTKIHEGIEYLFAFKVKNKVQVLEKHAEKRLVMAQGYAEEGNNERVQNLMQNYLQIKERQNNLLGKVNVGEVLGAVAESTIEQQKTMEEIKTRVNENTKQEVIQVQEQVVNQVAKWVVDVNGPEGTTDFLNEVAHVWAPGTGPGGEAGHIYAGGGKHVYATGTGPGGGESGVVIEGGEMKFATGASMNAPGADVKTVEIKTGGTVNDPVPVPDGPNYAPGTTSGGGNTNPTTNTIDPGGIDPGTSSDGETWLAP